MYPRVLKYVSSLDEMNKYNWSDFVVRYLIQAIKNLKKGILHSLYENMLMLVVSKRTKTCIYFLHTGNISGHGGGSGHAQRFSTDLSYSTR